MGPRRALAALVPSLVLLAVAPAAAQVRAATLVGPIELRASTDSADRPGLEFRATQESLRWPGEPPRSGIIATFPIERSIEIGVGRFRVVDPARLRTHTEFDRQPMSMRPRERGIAAVGVSFRF
jgi:hypothetical protein